MSRLGSERLRTGGASVLTGDAAVTDVLDGKFFYADDPLTKLEGTLVPLDTSDATAGVTDIVLGKTAYVNGSKLTGTRNSINRASENIVTSGLVLWLDGNDFRNAPSSPSWYDRSVNNLAVTAAGFTYSASSGSDGAGGIVFDGTDNKMTVAASAALGFTNAFTFELYAKPASETTDIYVMAKVNGINVIFGYVTKTYELYSNASYYTGTDPRTGSGIAVANVTSFNHVVYTLGAGHLKGYLNGTQVFDLEKTTSLDGSTTAYVFANNAAAYFGINLKMVRLYNAALTQEQVTQNYNAAIA